MSLFDYKESRELAAEGHGFAALIMTAARKADTENIRKLEVAFPEIVAELRARYNAPGGLLDWEIQ